jgi:glycosyltransferase involved in cell wall biosynthesis
MPIPFNRVGTIRFLSKREAMRPLFITGSLVHGGAERHTITLANKLTERGHECHAAYVKNDPSQLARFRGVASVQCLHAARYFDLAAVRSLACLMARLQPSSIVAANQYAMLYASLARRLAGVRAPLTVTWHSNRLQSMKEHLQMVYYRPFFWRADGLVFVCEAQQRHWHGRAVRSRRNEVIYNGVDTTQWTPIDPAESRRMRTSLGYADDDYVIALPAVLRPEKNHVQLVEAIAMLRRRGVRAKALMVGDGPTRGAVEDRARELGVTGHVAITGFQEQVRPFLAACDTAVLTSLSEAFSLAAVEAMAMARPVVHSDVGGAPEMIRPGREGYLYPVRDTAALVDRLSALADPAARAAMGETARRTVEARFSELAMVDRYEKLLGELETSAALSDASSRTMATAAWVKKSSIS